jgi:leucyl-tRNA synthetase
MAPHLAEEAWAALGGEGLAVDQPWPAHDPALLIDDEVTIAVQVNGKLRATVTAPRGATREDLQEMALSTDKIVALLADATPRKVIVVPDRLVNIVL